MGENIGACARAMGNCGLDQLRVVRPRDGWPNPAASPMAAGADWILDRATVYPNLRAATADLIRIYATTARTREQNKPVQTARTAAQHMRADSARGLRVGILFGRESVGLDNDGVALASALIRIPLNPTFMSLNLAQAVLLVAYEWLQAEELVVEPSSEPPAPMAAVQNLLDHLTDDLTEAGFFHVTQKADMMKRNLRNIFTRHDLTAQEINTLHGALVALAGRPRRRPAAATAADATQL
jgi:tRNA/rRNA methyltransferase